MTLGIHRLRTLFVWLVATGGAALAAAAAWGLALSGWHAVWSGHLAEIPFDRLVAELGAVVLLGCVAWLWLVTTIVVIEAVGGRPHPSTPRGVPGVLRRWVLAACGVALTTGGLSPAGAADHGAAHDRHPGLLAAVDGLPLPDRTTGGPTTVDRRPQPARRGELVSVVVRPGDTLWSIAAAALPAGAPDAAVVRGWHALYAVNRSAVGPDPDHITPGQRLVLPASGKDRR